MAELTAFAGTPQSAMARSSSSPERESLSGGESSGGGSAYGSAPSAARHVRSMGFGGDDREHDSYVEATEEEERQARLLTRRLALDHASRDVASFVRLEGPDEVAVIVPNSCTSATSNTLTTPRRSKTRSRCNRRSRP